MSGIVLGVDPGTRKAGFAAIDGQGRVIAQGNEPPETLVTRLRALTSERQIVAIALGAGTSSKQVRIDLAQMGAPIHLIDERETTLRARALYFVDHPPKGWRRLIPLGMQLPPCPIDDYAAILIARRYLLGGPAGTPS